MTFMRMPWDKSKVEQLDLVEEANAAPNKGLVSDVEPIDVTPLDLARFMRSRADAGDSNAEIASRMGIALTSVAYHLALLTLPPELDEVLRSGSLPS